ncbi:hypothetical protein THII_1635 [Thioploca ingrica]|uniref:Antitoxin n=1 Tax=Thioploca ingrica TaxID=40754 RepID=A0A090AK01_9GAMM|nr:hypothetical protein THII_1635 [Thioploca ingrica]
MQTISFLKACQDLAHLMQQVNDDHEPIKVEHPEKNAVVLISEQDYQGLMETLYLLSHPVNAEKLLQAVTRKPEEAMEWSQVKSTLEL